MTVKRRQPYIWVTWLSKVMAGEQACVWASWFKAHHQDYPKAPSGFELARWNVEHTRLLLRTRAKLSAGKAEVRIRATPHFLQGMRRSPCCSDRPPKSELAAGGIVPRAAAVSHSLQTEKRR
jgi:hypothetical protein